MSAGHTFFNRILATIMLVALAVTVVRGMVTGDSSSLTEPYRYLAWATVFFCGAVFGWLIAALLMRAHRFYGTWLPRDLYYLLYGCDKPIGRLKQ